MTYDPAAVYDELAALDGAALIRWALREQAAELAVTAQLARRRHGHRRRDAKREAARCEALMMRLLRLTNCIGLIEDDLNRSGAIRSPGGIPAPQRESDNVRTC